MDNDSVLDGVSRGAPTVSASFGRQANKGVLADQIATALGVPRREATRVLDAILDCVSALLRERGKVAVKGFGTFERRIRKGRAYKHPLTGESINVADRETIIFKPSDDLVQSTGSKQGAARRVPMASPSHPRATD